MRNFAPRYRPFVEMAQLHAQDRALEGIHAVVEALDQVVIALFLPPIALHSHFPRLPGIAGHNNAAFAAASQLRAGIEGEASRKPHASGPFAAIPGPLAPASILEHPNALTCRHADDGAPRLAVPIPTRTGRAPVMSIAAALATRVKGTVMTSSPGPTPAASNARCSALVPVLTATPYPAPQNLANSSSKAATSSPSTYWPDAR